MANNPHKRKNRFTIIILLAVFALPIVIAYTAYFGGWFKEVGSFNKGELINPVIDFSELKPTIAEQPIQFMTGEKWRIILPAKDEACLQTEEADGCLLSLYIMGQAHQALGKEKDRVKRQLYIGSQPIDEALLSSLQERFVDLEISKGETIADNRLSPDYIYVADPLGNIMLRYPIIRDKENAFIKGKDILYDLKKLLRMSRIG